MVLRRLPADWRLMRKPESLCAKFESLRAGRRYIHPEIRKSVGYFQQKTTELHALNRSVEETRIQLISQIDRLEELKAELEFRGAGQIGETVMRGQATLSNIQVIAANAQRLASDLNGFGRTPSAEAKPADGTNSAQAPKPPTAAAKPADAINPAPATKRR